MRRALLLTAMVCAGTQTSRAAPLPTLIAFDTIGSDSSDFSVPARALLSPVTALRLRFDLPVLANIADFRLFGEGEDRRLDSANCLVPASGDDVAVAMSAVRSVENGSEVVLTLSPTTGLSSGRYRLIVCDSLLGTSRLTLREFEIAESPQLDNPNFSSDLAGWAFSRTAGRGNFEADWSPIDADDATASGALRLAANSGSGGDLASQTCVQAPANTSGMVDYRIRFRYRVLSGRVRILATVAVGFSGDMGEPDCIGPGISHVEIIEAGTPTASFVTYDSGPLSLPAMPHASLKLYVIDHYTSDSERYELLLDDIALNFDTNAIFSSRFEANYWR